MHSVMLLIHPSQHLSNTLLRFTEQPAQTIIMGYHPSSLRDQITNGLSRSGGASLSCQPNSPEGHFSVVDFGDRRSGDDSLEGAQSPTSGSRPASPQAVATSQANTSSDNSGLAGSSKGEGDRDDKYQLPSYVQDKLAEQALWFKEYNERHPIPTERTDERDHDELSDSGSDSDNESGNESVPRRGTFTCSTYSEGGTH